MIENGILNFCRRSFCLQPSAATINSEACGMYAKTNLANFFSIFFQLY